MRKIQLVALCLVATACYACSESDDSKTIQCPDGQHDENGNCVDNPIKCPDGQHDENGNCVDNPIKCPDGQHDENGNCVSDKPQPIDPCKDMTCKSGKCIQGICVTPEMANYKPKDDNLDNCDPGSFVDYCREDNVPVYCDRGLIMVGEPCDEECAVYEDTILGRSRMRASCTDGGKCSKLNELKRTCEYSKSQKTSVVWATACQRTATNELKYISVDGYYCKGTCDNGNEKCDLVTITDDNNNIQDIECDPYDMSNYGCEENYITSCQLLSNLTATKRNYFCNDACVTLNGVAQCGTPCQTEGKTSHMCIYGDSMTVMDSGLTRCTKSDDGKLYNVWTSAYDYCDNGCNLQTGQCR